MASVFGTTWYVLVHLDTFRFLLCCLVPSCSTLTHLDTTWTLLEYLGTSWNILGTFLEQLGHSWTFLDILGHSWTFLYIPVHLIIVQSVNFQKNLIALWLAPKAGRFYCWSFPQHSPILFLPIKAYLSECFSQL